MGYLLHHAGAILVLAAAESGLARASDPVLTPLALVGLALLPHALAGLARRSFVSGRFRRGARQVALVHLCPVPLYALAVAGFGWIDYVERWSGREAAFIGWPHPVMLVALVPYLLFALAAIDARARAGGGTARALHAERSFHTRLFLGGGLPIALFIVIAWLIGLSEPVRVHIEEVAVWSAAFSMFLVALAVWSLPRLLTVAWDTLPLAAGPARDLLEGTAAAAGFRCRDLFVWRTGDLVANAAIVGVSARQRVVLFSDLLLRSLDPRELTAVFAHEIGHARRHHVVVFGIWTLGFLMALDLVLGRFDAEDELLALGALLPLVGLWFAGFGFLSRRFELDADLFSLELLDDGPALSSALLRVGGGLHAAKRGSWRHFSTERRIRFLERAAKDPAESRRLRRSVRALAALGLAVFLVAGWFQVASMAASWQSDQLMADLRLGRYAAAEKRLARADELDPDLAHLVRLASGLALQGGDAPAELETSAQAALARDERAVARDLVRLLVLRGEPLTGVLDVLDDPDRRPSAAIPEPWLAPLQAWLRTRG